MEPPSTPRLSIVAAYGATNSSVRVRGLHWARRLVEQGQLSDDDVVTHTPWTRSVAVASTGTTLLMRNASRFTRGQGEARLLTAAQLGVYDLDDGLPWDDGRLPGLGHWWKRPWPRDLLARRAAAAADRVIAGNQLLAEWASEHCADVRLIPTCIEPADYRRRTSWQIGDSGPLIGWIGSPATEGYLVDIAPALREVQQRSGARFEMISASTTVPAALHGLFTAVAWQPDSVRRIAEWDVGIMPLRDGVYERAKCGYKLLQYAASGVPAVASPVGVNTEMLTAMDGIAATTDSEWIDALAHLVGESADRRAQRATAGFVVADDYSYDRWQSAWVDAVGAGAP